MIDVDSPPPFASPRPQSLGPVQPTPPVSRYLRLLRVTARLSLYAAIFGSLLWLVRPLMLAPRTPSATGYTADDNGSVEMIATEVVIEGRWQLVGSGLGASVTRFTQQQLDSELRAATDNASRLGAARQKGQTYSAPPSKPDLADPDLAALQQDSLEFQQSIRSLLSVLPAEVTDSAAYRSYSGQYSGVSFRVFTSHGAESEVYSAMAWWPADDTDWNFASINVAQANNSLAAEWIPEDLPVSGNPLARRISSDGEISGAAWPCDLPTEKLLEWFERSKQPFVVEENREDILLGRWSPEHTDHTLVVVGMHRAETGLLILLSDAENPRLQP
ncbi:MAG: hypothetical protein RLZZ232_3111 [Planctomycetota bacterium]|jgi:hypothetical protein